MSTRRLKCPADPRQKPVLNVVQDAVCPGCSTRSAMRVHFAHRSYTGCDCMFPLPLLHADGGLLRCSLVHRSLKE